MLDRVPFIHRITSAFALMESYLKLNSRQNLNTAAVLAEDFCVNLLNLLYGANFTNLNAEKLNAPAVDLVFRKKRLAFQITINDTTAKIRDTHLQAATPDIANNFDRITILFLVHKAPPLPKKSANFTPCTSPAIVVRDLSSILGDIRGLDIDCIGAIAELLEREISNPVKPWNRDAILQPTPDFPLGGVFLLPNTHRANPHFIPKPEIVASLANLKSGDVLVLYGLGGVGKTQHAVQYAHEHRHGYRIVLWVSADTVQSLNDSLAALADLPGLDLRIDKNAPHFAKIQALFDFLTSRESWLLILDNADSEVVGLEIERTLPSSHCGHVIITSRISIWNHAFRVQSVDVWDEEQSCHFLKKRFGDTFATQEELGKLCITLGGLPLALEQGAAYIMQTRISVSDYLDLLARDGKKLLARRHPGMTDYRASVATTWQVTINQLGYVSRHILDLVSCLSSEAIPRRILDHLASVPVYVPAENPWKILIAADSDSLNFALADLALYSLISLSEDSLRIHPLLQAVVREMPQRVPWHYGIWRRLYGLPDKYVWQKYYWPYHAAMLLNADGVLPWRVWCDVGILEMRHYAPHIDALLSHLSKVVFGHHIPYFCLENLVSSYRKELSKFELTADFLRSSLARNVELSPHLKEETEWFMSNFENLYRQAVRQTYGERLLQKFISIPNTDRPKQWTIYEVIRDLGRRTASAGDYTAAHRLFQLGFDHATTDALALPEERGYSRIQEALALYHKKPENELLALLEEGLTILRDLNSDRSTNLEALCLYARMVRTPAHKAHAIELLRNAITQAHQYISAGLGDGFLAIDVLIGLLRDSDQADEANDICEQSLRLARRAHKRGRNHRAMLWVSRGALLADRSNFFAAARAYSHAVFLGRRDSNPDLINQAGLLNNCGEMFYRAGNLPMANFRLTEATYLLDQGWTVNCGFAEHIAILLALSLTRTGRRPEGYALFQRALDSRMSRLGPNNPELAPIHRLFGISLHEAGRGAEAIKEFRRALLLKQKQPGCDDAEFRPYLTSLRRSLEDFGELDEHNPVGDDSLSS